MDIFFSITNATAEAVAMAAVLMAVCGAAAWAVSAPGRRTQVAHDKAAPPEHAFECHSCGIQWRCTDTLDRPLRCPHCGTANKET